MPKVKEVVIAVVFVVALVIFWPKIVKSYQDMRHSRYVHQLDQKIAKDKEDLGKIREARALVEYYAAGQTATHSQFEVTERTPTGFTYRSADGKISGEVRAVGGELSFAHHLNRPPMTAGTKFHFVMKPADECKKIIDGMRSGDLEQVASADFLAIEPLVSRT